MKLGYLGLGKMGKNMVFRLLEKNHQVIAWNRSPEPRDEVAAAGATEAESIEELVKQLQPPRVIWLMLPSGDVTGQTIDQLSTLLQPGDTLIDGSNSHFKDTHKRAEALSKKSINFLDCGVSGGPSGARNGACLMIGGHKDVFAKVEPLFKDIAAPGAYQFFEGWGAGHFVKMVHNGIEYGMMQAIGEGFEIMEKSDFDLNLEHVAKIYQHRSVIESRLIGWTLSGFKEHGTKLDEFSAPIGSGGAAGLAQSEAKWTLDVANEQGTQAKVLQDSIQARIDSQKKQTYQTRIVNLLRNQFGGHSVKNN